MLHNISAFCIQIDKKTAHQMKWRDSYELQMYVYAELIIAERLTSFVHKIFPVKIQYNLFPIPSSTCTNVSTYVI